MCRNTVKATALSVAALLCASAALTDSLADSVRIHAGERANILFFYVDDMGWHDTSVRFHPELGGNERPFRTPNMQRLAEEGMKFTHAYAHAVCSPSRVSLMTGQSPLRHRVTNWTLYRDTDQSQNHPHLRAPQWNVNGLQPLGTGIPRSVEAPTLAELLRAAGYTTVHVGKAHLGAKGPPKNHQDGTPGNDPANLGFDVNIAGHGAGGPGSFLGTNNFSARYRKGAPVWDIPGLDPYHGEDIFLTEALTREAIKALDAARAAGKPFFLKMSHYAVHVPLYPDERFIQRYRDMGLSEPMARYASMIEGMDKSLGDLLDYLEEHDLADNTVVLFTSDNGGLALGSGFPADMNRPLRAGKASIYEGGIRVPAIVRWPGKVAPGSTCDANTLIAAEDLYPTLLTIAGAAIPDEYRAYVDGVDISPLLTGDGTYDRNRPMFFHYPHQWGRGPDYQPYTAMIRGEWKLIYFYGDGVKDGRPTDPRWELYNPRADIGERYNLLEEQEDVANRLARELVEKMEQVEALRPIVKQTGEPAPLPYVPRLR